MNQVRAGADPRGGARDDERHSLRHRRLAPFASGRLDFITEGLVSPGGGDRTSPGGALLVPVSHDGRCDGGAHARRWRLRQRAWAMNFLVNEDEGAMRTGETRRQCGGKSCGAFGGKSCGAFGGAYGGELAGES